MTKYENEILNLINSSHDHLSAEEIFLKLKENGSKAVLATVYNNLNKLVDSGKIRKLSVDGVKEHYDRVEPHDHLICSRCGKITDKKFSDLSQFIHQQMGEDFISYDLKVYYLCPDCRKRMEEEI